jgi:hypothetical protein
MPFINISGVRALIEPEDRLIQLDDVTETEVPEVWRQIKKEYPGFTVDFCFHNTVAPIDFLREIKAEVLEDCIELRLAPGDMKDIQVKKTVPVDEENFEQFALFHDKVKDPEMFWNSEKIRKNRAEWGISALYDSGEIKGYAMIRSGWEIYCVTADNIEAKVALTAAMVSVAEKKAFPAGKEVLFMVDRDDYPTLDAASQLGFRRAGFYIGYRAQA